MASQRQFQCVPTTYDTENKEEIYIFQVSCPLSLPLFNIPNCQSVLKFLSLNCNCYTPPANFVCRGYTVFTLSVRPSVRPSVTFCFLNNSKSHCWIFIKPCKHVHICKTNTLDKKVRARGQFYLSYFPL